MISPKIQGRGLVAIEKVLLKLAGYPGFENRPPIRVNAELVIILNTEQVADKACIIKIQLGVLYEPLGEVPMMGSQQEDEVTSL